jgi:hypothetical protein
MSPVNIVMQTAITTNIFPLLRMPSAGAASWAKLKLLIKKKTMNKIDVEILLRID